MQVTGTRQQEAWALRELPPGTRVVTEGPYGALTEAVRSRRKVLLIAGGVGITPLRALLESLPARPGDLTLIYRVSSMRDAVFRHELEQLAQRRGAQVWFVAGSRARLGEDPLSAAALSGTFSNSCRTRAAGWTRLK